MSIHDRIKLVIKWLIGSGIANNQESLGRLIGYTNKSSFSQILNNKVAIPNGFIDKLCALNENINKVWIEEGVGDMIHDNSQSSFEPSKAPVSSDIVILRLMDKLDEKDNIIKDKESKIDQLQAELRKMSEELATFKAKYPEATADHPKVLGPAKDASTKRPSSPNADNVTSATAP